MNLNSAFWIPQTAFLFLLYKKERKKVNKKIDCSDCVRELGIALLPFESAKKSFKYMKVIPLPTILIAFVSPIVFNFHSYDAIFTF